MIKQGVGRKLKYPFDKLVNANDYIELPVSDFKSRKNIQVSAKKYAQRKGFNVTTETLCNDGDCVLRVTRGIKLTKKN